MLIGSFTLLSISFSTYILMYKYIYMFWQYWKFQKSRLQTQKLFCAWGWIHRTGLDCNNKRRWRQNCSKEINRIPLNTSASISFILPPSDSLSLPSSSLILVHQRLEKSVMKYITNVAAKKLGNKTLVSLHSNEKNGWSADPSLGFGIIWKFWHLEK